MKPFKKRLFKNILRNQSGQAMVEYVLVVIISVTLLFLAKGIFSGLNNFMTSYVGGYFKCLMVQGELPALSVSDGDLNKHSSANYKCSVSYQQGTIAGDGSTGGGKTVGTIKPITTAKGSTKETASRRSGVSNSSSASKFSKKAKKPNNRVNSDSDSNDTLFSSSLKNRSDTYSSSDAESSSEEQSVYSVSMSSPRNVQDPEKHRTITGPQADDILKKTRGGGINRRNNAPKTTPLADEYRPGPRKNKLIPPTRNVAAANEQVEEPFSFGYFLKWIIIAGIVIALIVFFGGQVLNYSKSDSE